MILQEKGSPYLTRINGLPYAAEFPQYAQQFAQWVNEGRIKVRIDRTFPLAEASKAHEAFERREVSGRILLFP
jgi:NADPH2:quinone reductase